MKALVPRFLFLAAATIAVSFMAVADAVDHHPATVTGSYLIYSGELDDMDLPNRKDAKISLEIKGALAKDMFKHLRSRAAAEGCEEGVEVREKGDLICYRDLGTKEVTCHFGLDLKSGKLINGVIC